MTQSTLERFEKSARDARDNWQHYAQAMLGWAVTHGEGGRDKNPEEAIQLLEAAATGGYEFAMTELAKLDQVAAVRAQASLNEANEKRANSASTIKALLDEAAIPAPTE